ncbi:MAG: hypothetical protein AAF004_07245 [Pseudomonadota bacterium]
MAQGVRSDKTGMSIVEAPASGQRITPSAHPVAAFLGRTISGPLHQPVSVSGYAAFERMFGGAPDGHGLGTTLQQFFEHGGKRAVVVRLANDARCGYLDVPCEVGSLRLMTVNPGSAERLRASIDYDGIQQPDSFNLTVQRLDISGRHILDQELYSGVSVDAASRHFIGRALEHSQLVQLSGDSENQTLSRPTEMRAGITTVAIGYVGMRAHGDDGRALSDYDLVGSDRKSTGMFALETIPHFDFLYAAHEIGQSGPGAAFVVAAEMYCQRRNALLVIDPPTQCDDVAALVGWRRRQQHAGHSSLAYFPALYHRHKPSVVHSAAGALIGLLCRHDEREHVFAALADDTRQNSAALHRDWLPCVDVDAEDALQLLRLGVNPLVTGQQRRLLFPGLVTCANLGDRNAGSLTLQRLTKFILRQIDFGTRWALLAPQQAETWHQIEVQVQRFMAELASAGAFKVAPGQPGWWVRCDALTNGDSEQSTSAFRLLLGFHPRAIAAPVMYSISQHHNGASVVRTALHSDSH